MIYLDTHIVVWLYAGLKEKFSLPAKKLINENDLYVSPIVRLELQYLYEIQRITVDSRIVIADLSSRIALQVCDNNFNAIVGLATEFSWTRDPFDRLIVANASLHDNILVSKDRNILAHYPHARW
ncbi:MAG TPA: PIN domain-containing protein [Anaerolineae bacterium]|nr:PIN domain-containing protein [Anaerolineae bacterium]